MRTVLAAIHCAKGDIATNLAAHLEIATTAAEGDLVLFPEMSLTGSANPATDPHRLIQLDHPAVQELASATSTTGTGACFGIAERGPDGDPYIAQVFATGGQIAGIQRKRHLPDDEKALGFRLVGASQPGRREQARRAARPVDRAGGPGWFDRRRGLPWPRGADRTGR